MPRFDGRGNPIVGGKAKVGGAAKPKRSGKKSTSNIGKLDRVGRTGPHPTGQQADAARAQPGRAKGAPKLGRADAKALAEARKAKRPSSAQRDVLAAASVRKTAANGRRSATLKGHHARRRKLAALAGKTHVGKYVPGGPHSS